LILPLEFVKNNIHCDKIFVKLEDDNIGIHFDDWNT
jgi:hypothetical protein